uniref:Uncharacterized protein n=1 Tax=viral metagenome TaxID=1070528 RepID=A0A6C0CJQ0_9ZZZZ
MGNCCGLCCYACFKNTFYSLELADSILSKIESHLKNHLPLKGSLQTWYISLKKDIYNQLRESIATRICRQLEDLHFPVLSANGFVKEHLAENIAFVISSCILNNDYQVYISTMEYQCLDIPTNTLFYTKPKIEVKTETLTSFVDYLIQIKDEAGNIKRVELHTENKTHHKIFDKRLEEKLIDILHQLSNQKINEIIKKSYMHFTSKHEEEERILSINKKNTEADRYSSFV